MKNKAVKKTGDVQVIKAYRTKDKLIFSDYENARKHSLYLKKVEIIRECILDLFHGIDVNVEDTFTEEEIVEMMMENTNALIKAVEKLEGYDLERNTCSGIQDNKSTRT